MTNPAVQNDFSYYRRTLSRLKMANQVSPCLLHLKAENKPRQMLDFIAVLQNVNIPLPHPPPPGFFWSHIVLSHNLQLLIDIIITILFSLYFY